MRLILLGPPGSGKGTQANLLQDKYNIPKISTGDILRAAMKDNTEFGEQAKRFMDKGELVPDEVVIGLIKKRIVEPDCQTGFICGANCEFAARLRFGGLIILTSERFHAVASQSPRDIYEQFIPSFCQCV